MTARPAPPGARSSAKPPSQRQLRVGEEIRHVLAGIFARGEIRDPELAGVSITVTEVRVGPDLKRATAFVARLGRSDADALLPALRRAAPFLRSQLARSLRLRVAPDLSFQADTSMDYAMQVDRLLRQPEVARDLRSGSNKARMSATAPGLGRRRARDHENPIARPRRGIRVGGSGQSSRAGLGLVHGPGARIEPAWRVRGQLQVGEIDCAADRQIGQQRVVSRQQKGTVSGLECGPGGWRRQRAQRRERHMLGEEAA